MDFNKMYNNLIEQRNANLIKKLGSQDELRMQVDMIKAFTGFSYKKFAQELGISPAAFYNWRQRQYNFSDETKMALGVLINDLVSNKYEINKNYGVAEKPVSYSRKVKNVSTNTIYQDARIAASAIGQNEIQGSRTIVRCCKGERNTAYGYKWEFVIEDKGDK